MRFEVRRVLLASAVVLACQKDNQDYGDPGPDESSSSSSTTTTHGTTGVTTSTTSTTTTSGTTDTTRTTADGSTSGAPIVGWRQRLEIQPVEGDFTEVLEDVPVLVELTPAVFAYDDAATDGTDLRFYDAPPPCPSSTAPTVR